MLISALQRKFVYTLLTFAFLLAPRTVFGAPHTELKGYRYRVPFTLENKTATLQPAMPVALRVDTLRLIGLGKLKPDGSDLRIINEKGAEVPRVTEGLHDDSDAARIWFRAPEISPKGKVEYSLLYGKSDVPQVDDAHAKIFVPAPRPATAKLALDFDNPKSDAVQAPPGRPDIVAPQAAPSYHGSGLWFNGQNAGAHLKLSDVSELNSGFTVELWIQPTAHVNNRNQSYLNIDNVLQLTGEGRVYLRSTEGLTSADVKLSFFEWNHVAITFTGSDLILFLNGEEAARAPVKGKVAFKKGEVWLGYEPTVGRFFAPFILDDLTVHAKPITSFDAVHPPPAIAPGKEEISATARLASTPQSAERPIFIAVEAEDFAGVANDKNYQSFEIAKSGKWHKSYDRYYLSRRFGIFTLSQGASASATVNVPRLGEYSLWVRYAPVGEAEHIANRTIGSSFQMRIEQRGQTVATHDFGAKLERQSQQARWESTPVRLEAGSAKLELLKTIANPQAGEKIDLVLLTTDKEYIPDYRHFSSVWLRWTPLELAPAGPYRGRVRVLRHDGDPWFSSFNLNGNAVNLAPGQPSEWLDTSTFVNDAVIAPTFTLTLKDAKNIAPTSGKFQIDFARRPTEAGIYKSVVVSSDNGFGITVPGTNTPLTEFESSSESVNNWAASHLARARAQQWPKPNLPQGITVSTAVLPGAFGHDVARNELLTMREMGINFPHSSHHAFGSKELAQLAEEIGYTDIFVSFHIHDFPFAGSGPYDEKFWQVVEQRLEQVAKSIAERSSLDRVRWVALDDEIAYWERSASFFAKPSNFAAFKLWLNAKKIAPEFLELKSWNEIKPLGKRSQAVSTPQKRLWALQSEFLSDTAAMVYRRATEMWRQKAGPQVQTTINPSPHLFMRAGFALDDGGLNYFDFWKQKGVSTPWSEDWSSSTGWLFISAEVTSYITDILRAGATPNNAPTGIYITPGGPEAQRLKVYSALAHGARHINYYIYGPQYAMTEGTWSESVGTFNEIGHINYEIAQAADLLASAKMRKAPVAMLYSYSGDLWQRDASALTERFYLYLALKHAQVPVDIVTEEQIAEGALQDYKVLYVVDENIQRAAMAPLAKWVNAGGTLVAFLNAGTRDEYDTASNSFDQLLGLAARDVMRDEKSVKLGFHRSGLGSAKEVAQLSFSAPLPVTKMSVYGLKADNVTVKSASVIGQFEDGSPAATLNKSGKGTALFIGALPGISYARGSNVNPGQYTTEYPADIRELITAPLAMANVHRDVELSTPVVEATLQESDKGAVVTLVNYSMQELPEVTMTARPSKPVKSVFSVRQNKAIPFTKTADGIRLKLPLGLGDFIKLYF